MVDNFSVSVGNIVELLDDVRRDVNSGYWTTSNERIVIDEPFVDGSLFCTIGFVAKEMKLGWNSTGRRSGYVKTGADVSALHFHSFKAERTPEFILVCDILDAVAAEEFGTSITGVNDDLGRDEIVEVLSKAMTFLERGYFDEWIRMFELNPSWYGCGDVGDLFADALNRFDDGSVMSGMYEIVAEQMNRNNVKVIEVL
jgi:hypothetical protein